ncbi:MAG: AtpZ/AtpI family protein [Candidatus Margulisiibacteriota bacterium]|jgi:ATP synthase protein I
MKDDWGQISKSFSLLSQIGLMMALNILVFFLAGRWLDGVLHSKGLFLIIFILLGIFSGFFNVYKIIMNVMKD